jgi:putative iron-dependent peroxidase
MTWGAWNALPVEAQERVIGRTKLSNVELPDDVEPTNFHVALDTLAGPDGEERQIVRDDGRRRSVRHLLIAYSPQP